MNYYRSPRGIRYGAVSDVPALSPRLSPQGTKAGSQGGKTHQVTVRVPLGSTVQVDQVNYPSQRLNLNDWMLADGHPAVRRVEAGVWEVRTRARVTDATGAATSINKALLRITVTAPDGVARSFPEAVIAADDPRWANLIAQGRFFPGDPQPTTVASSTTKDYVAALAVPPAGDGGDDLDDLDEGDGLLPDDELVVDLPDDYVDPGDTKSWDWSDDWRPWAATAVVGVAAVLGVRAMRKKKAAGGGGAGAANYLGRGGRRDWDDGYRY